MKRGVFFFYRFSLAHSYSPVSFGMQTNHNILGGKKLYFAPAMLRYQYEFLQIGSGKRRLPFSLCLGISWLHQVNQTDSTQAEQGKEMGFRFAEMIPPDRDWSDISLRECSALLVAVVWCFSDLRFFHSAVASQICRNLYSSLLSLCLWLTECWKHYATFDKILIVFSSSVFLKSKGPLSARENYS